MIREPCAVMDYGTKAFADARPPAKIVAAVEKIEPSSLDMQFAFMAGGYGPVTNKVSDLKPLLPYIFNIHGKFYEMTDELREYSIPYEEIIPALIERWTQDMTITDRCWEGSLNSRSLGSADDGWFFDAG